jgi:hypothetical protein
MALRDRHDILQLILPAAKRREGPLEFKII